MRDCNNDAVLNKVECNAVISYLSTILFVFSLLFLIWNFINVICTCLWILSPNKDGNNN